MSLQRGCSWIRRGLDKRIVALSGLLEWNYKAIGHHHPVLRHSGLHGWNILPALIHQKALCELQPVTVTHHASEHATHSPCSSSGTSGTSSSSGSTGSRCCSSRKSMMTIADRYVIIRLLPGPCLLLHLIDVLPCKCNGYHGYDETLNAK